MHGEYKMPGAKLVVIDLEVRDGKLADVQLSGDFFLEPDSALHMIDAALEGLPANTAPEALATVVAAALPATAILYGISPEAVAVAIQRAVHGEPGT
ncbi:MAG: biotin--protein ligase [Rhodanobacter sp.]